MQSRRSDCVIDSGSREPEAREGADPRRKRHGGQHRHLPVPAHDGGEPRHGERHQHGQELAEQASPHLGAPQHHADAEQRHSAADQGGARRLLPDHQIGECRRHEGHGCIDHHGVGHGRVPERADAGDHAGGGQQRHGQRRPAQRQQDGEAAAPLHGQEQREDRRAREHAAPEQHGHQVGRDVAHEQARRRTRQGRPPPPAEARSCAVCVRRWSCARGLSGRRRFASNSRTDSAPDRPETAWQPCFCPNP